MKIMVAMSGGVDSTMTAKFLQEAGHEVQGCYMMLHQKPGYHEENIRKVKKVGEYLGIKVHILDLQDKFNEYVYDPFVRLYKEGKTPNPCALCNKFIKLGALLDFAKANGCEKLATGHYVQVVDGFITCAKDPSKDQSYFLAQVPKEVLKDVIFPLGDKFKKDIKELARGVKVLEEFATQAESSEICFVENTYIEVLNKHYNTNLPGNVVGKDGKVIGRHQGYMHYTIGKRRGVNLFIDEDKFECETKIRYRSPKLEAFVEVDKANKTAKLTLNQNALGVAQGQLCVMYEGDRVIASGFIKN